MSVQAVVDSFCSLVLLTMVFLLSTLQPIQSRVADLVLATVTLYPLLSPSNCLPVSPLAFCYLLILTFLFLLPHSSEF